MRIFRPLTSVLALFLATFVCSASCKSDSVSREPIEVDLNKTLTNAMSDSVGMEGLDMKVRGYMNTWGLKGVSLAIMRNDSLLYAKGYGWADEAQGIKMEPSNILRLASVSKLVTAASIMLLQERGKLSLADTVFGPHGILNDEAYTKAIKNKLYFNITVEDLLRHKGGFGPRGMDPMFSTRGIMIKNGLSKPPTNKELIPLVLKYEPIFEPGTSQSYSNFGFMLLGQIIEKVTGENYEDFVRENLLIPAGCYDFHIANNYYKERYPGEVRYYVPANSKPVPEYNNSGKNVTRCYGGNDIRALGAAGAWVASVPELARFVASIDGNPIVRDVINSLSVIDMIEYIDKDTFSLGWNDTNPETGWQRTGSFSGTNALIRYYPDGECWILVSNTSTWKGHALSRETTALFNDLREKYSSKLPTRDLFKK